MAFVEDISAFFADFGVDATLAQQSTVAWPGDPLPFAAVDVRVIFDNPTTQVDEVMAPVPQAQIDSDDVPHYVLGAKLIVLEGPHAGTYLVRESIPDGTGLTLLMLTAV